MATRSAPTLPIAARAARGAAAGAKDPPADARLRLTALLGLDLVQVAVGGFPRDALEAAISGSIRRQVD